MDTLEQFADGDLNYVSKHNTNVSRIENAVKAAERNIDDLLDADFQGQIDTQSERADALEQDVSVQQQSTGRDEFRLTYPAALADLDDFALDAIVEINADENYDGRPTKYKVVAGPALQFLRILPSKQDFDEIKAMGLEDFPYFLQGQLPSFFVRRLLVEAGKIPQASPALVYDFCNKQNSQVNGDPINILTDTGFTRASPSYGQFPSGAPRAIAVDELRFAYDENGKCLGHLPEKQRTNLTRFSNELDNLTRWERNQIQAPVRQVGAGPSGSNAVDALDDAWLITDTVDGAVDRHFLRSLIYGSGQFPRSFYVKIPETNGARYIGIGRASDNVNPATFVVFDLVDGVIADQSNELLTGIEKLHDGWFRVHGSLITDSANVLFRALNLVFLNGPLITNDEYQGNGDLSILVAGAQFENTKNVRPSSYIDCPADASVTRLIDDVDELLQEGFNNEVWGFVYHGYADPDGKAVTPVDYNNGSNNQTALVVLRSGEARLQVNFNGGNGSIIDLPPVPNGSFFKLAARIQKDNVAFSVNGAFGKDTLVDVPIVTRRRLGIGLFSPATVYETAPAAFFQEFHRPLSDAEIVELSTL